MKFIYFQILCCVVLVLHMIHGYGHGSSYSGKSEYPRPPFTLPYASSSSSSKYLVKGQRSYSEPTYITKPRQDYSGYNDYCNPRAPPKCLNKTLGFCLEDYEYPEYEIKEAIKKDQLIVKKYADLPDQSANDLVDGISRYQEDYFDYSSYKGLQFDKGNWIGGEGYICPSHVLYAKPVRAKNIEGDWRVIVQNVDYYTQTERVELCLYPSTACRLLPPCYRSSCLQQYVYHRMLALDPCDPYKGLFIDIFKLPSACSCHISFREH